MRFSRFLLIGALGMAACKSAPPGQGPSSAPATARRVPTAEPGAVLFPPPFTAAQIRDATPVGRTYRWKLSGPESTGERMVRFVEVGPERAKVAAVNIGPSGIGSLPEGQWVSWGELVEHATYPASGTQVSEVEVEVPAGRFDAWLYDVKIPTDDGLRRTKAWFALELPGAPVKHEVYMDGALQSRMELIEHAASGAR